MKKRAQGDGALPWQAPGPRKKEPGPREGEGPLSPSPCPGWVYMMRCKDGSLYTGWTNDLPARVAAHMTGRGAKYTRAFGAVALAYAEALPSRAEALRREAALKRLPKARKEALCAAWRAAGPAAPGFGADGAAPRGKPPGET